MSYYLEKPAVPFLVQRPPFVPGTMVQVTGIPDAYVQWFAVNFQIGPSLNPRDDIALHISPRFEGNMSKVIRNSLQRNAWGLEENFGHFPFLAGQHFELLILCDQDNFKIAVNGEHYTEFRYRIPLNAVNTLAIDGDVQLLSVRIEAPQMPQGLVSPSYGTPAMSSSGVAPPIGFLGSIAGPNVGTAPTASAYSGPTPVGTTGYASPYPSGYSTNQMLGTSHSPCLQSSSKSLKQDGSHDWMKKAAGFAGAGLAGGALGGLVGTVASRLVYPGHHGHGGIGVPFGHHHGKGHKMKLKHHKPKLHKKHKFHKGGKKSSSSSSSSSD